MVRDENYLKELVEYLIKFPKETDWLEFKKNYYDPESIGQYISALSNAAALNQVQYGYLIFGINYKLIYLNTYHLYFLLFLLLVQLNQLTKRYF